MTIDQAIADAVRAAVKDELSPIFERLEVIEQKLTDLINDRGQVRAADIEDLRGSVDCLANQVESWERRETLREIRGQAA